MTPMYGDGRDDSRVLGQNRISDWNCLKCVSEERARQVLEFTSCENYSALAMCYPINSLKK